MDFLLFLSLFLHGINVISVACSHEHPEWTHPEKRCEWGLLENGSSEGQCRSNVDAVVDVDVHVDVFVSMWSVECRGPILM